MQLRTLGVEPTLRSLTNAIYGTYALNIVFPRLGEVWRCGYVAKREGLSFTQVLGSILSDRFCDTVAVLSIAAVAFALQMRVLLDFFTQFPQLEQAIMAIVTSPWLYIGCLLLIGGVVYLFKYRSESALIQRIKGIGKNLWNGFATVLHMKHKWGFLLCTVAIWVCYFMQLYLCFFAFASTEHLGILVALALFAVGSLSMGIPVQAGLGTWHVAIIATLVLYGVDENQAGAFALVAHGAQMLMLVVMGIYATFSIALDKKRDENKRIA